jgi:NTE family protein
VTINTYYTPTVLTTNPLVFDSKMMRKWWQRGYLHAKSINQSKK